MLVAFALCAAGVFSVVVGRTNWWLYFALMDVLSLIALVEFESTDRLIRAKKKAGADEQRG
jgi:hypothetical protein